MPVVAVSKPLSLGASNTATPTATPTNNTPEPYPFVFETPTPEPTYTQPPVTWTPIPIETQTPGPVSTYTGFSEQHSKFIAQVDSIATCFKKEDIAGFDPDELDEHIATALTDKYITQSGDTYCSMQSVKKLEDSLKRLGE